MPKTKSHLVGIFFLCLPCVLGTVKFELYQIESMVLMLLLCIITTVSIFLYIGETPAVLIGNLHK